RRGGCCFGLLLGGSGRSGTGWRCGGIALVRALGWIGIGCVRAGYGLNGGWDGWAVVFVAGRSWRRCRGGDAGGDRHTCVFAILGAEHFALTPIEDFHARAGALE